MKTTTMQRTYGRGCNAQTRITRMGTNPLLGKAGMIRWIEPEIGDVVTVHSVPGAYPLPAGLPEGAQLRLVRCEDSIRIVERDEWEWRGYMMSIDGEYERGSGQLLVDAECGGPRTGGSVEG